MIDQQLQETLWIGRTLKCPAPLAVENFSQLHRNFSLKFYGSWQASSIVG